MGIQNSLAEWSDFSDTKLPSRQIHPGDLVRITNAETLSFVVDNDREREAIVGDIIQVSRIDGNFLSYKHKLKPNQVGIRGSEFQNGLTTQSIPVRNVEKVWVESNVVSS